jgi:hypothetical protein
MKRRVIILGIALASGLLVVRSAAAPPAPPSTLNVVAVSPPDINFGEQVTFTVSTTALFWNVTLECRQAGALVLHGGGIIGDIPTVTLASPSWLSGPADCTANLNDYARWKHPKLLASTSFVVT